MTPLNNDDASNPTLRDLASEIGYVQIYWSFLESAMLAQLQAAGVQVAKGPIISRWRIHMQKQLSSKADLAVTASHLKAVEEVAAPRNLLAHGIQSVTADPWEKGSAVVACAATDGSVHRLTVEMIRSLSEEIDRVRRLITGQIAGL
ncbi:MULTISPECIES: hypothetical protein [unclassified Rhizobium]|uniref:hypothetical protein n=1 Tax=unclassified Rhizobium TaxID=2613769 RepID=UPI0011AB7427|nr:MULTISPECIES: hypothetical protein [unclassified Rhizobium]